MALKEYKPEKLLYTMGEVTEMFDVKPSLIRFWVDRFDVLKPKKNKKGNRLFTPADVKNLEVIYHLTKERGMTLAGVEKYLKNNKEEAERDTEIVRRLQTIRALLVEIREELKEEPEGEIRVFTATDAPETDTAPQPEETAADATLPQAEIPDPEEFAEEVLPGEIVLEEIVLEEIGLEEESETDFWEEEQPAGEETEEPGPEIPDKAEPDETEPDLPEEIFIEEEIVDAEVSEPFTAQPLFDLEETEGFVPEETPEEMPPEEEIRPTTVDTQQSLF